MLTAANIAQVEAVAAVAREAGADRLGIIPVHDFGQGEPTADASAVAAGMAALRRLHASGFLDNSLAYVDLVPRALAGGASPLRCYAPQASVVVDCYGDVYPCFPLMERARARGAHPPGPRLAQPRLRGRSGGVSRPAAPACGTATPSSTSRLPQTARLAERAV